jgi:hypothetical protein
LDPSGSTTSATQLKQGKQRSDRDSTMVRVTQSEEDSNNKEGSWASQACTSNKHGFMSEAGGWEANEAQNIKVMDGD